MPSLSVRPDIGLVQYKLRENELRGGPEKGGGEMGGTRERWESLCTLDATSARYFPAASVPKPFFTHLITSTAAWVKFLGVASATERTAVVRVVGVVRQMLLTLRTLEARRMKVTLDELSAKKIDGVHRK